MKMKKCISMMVFLCGCLMSMQAQSLSSLAWKDVCNGKMGEAWYGTDEAKAVADVVLYVQKDNGGWMKNDQLHKLSDAEKEALHNQRSQHSCLDNGATTQEMRFLAKVYKHTGEERYKESIIKALDMIFAAEKSCGGWSQYWPLTGGGSYQDYITFNDDLMTNVMRLLKDMIDDKGDLQGLVDEARLGQCQAAFDKAIDVILACQIDDNGTPAAWCAQHDPTTFLPTEGRPHELPSVSGSESASLLSFLMTIEKPSEQLKEAINTAIAWLDAHKIEGKAVEDYTNGKGEEDRHVVDKEGSAIWGRFIQLGGASAETTYNAFFKKLKDRNKKRSYTDNGKTYTYTEYEIATTSYDPSKAYQPIYAIYDESLQHMYYRFLYNYEDTDPVKDSKGCTVLTSLTASNRKSYQYLGSWCQKVIQQEYPAWKQRIEQQEQSEGYETHVLSAETYVNSPTTTTYAFDGDITITNAKNKSYATGKSNTIKYSANEYVVHLPEGMKIAKVSFYGYDNYADADAYIKKFNGTTYGATDYVFPAKTGSDNFVYVTHTFDVSDAPITDEFSFSIGSKQCCLIITLFEAQDTPYIVGDVNGDGKVDVSDYIGVANHILGSTQEGFNEKAADVDGNGSIDVSDYIGVANLILTGSIYGN